ncbi:MAG TPA: hypothetical protein VM121_02075 [Acidimicrobiales bacterium]|nr:hypothetical protein [Acidimicrobiales bacterium]
MRRILGVSLAATAAILCLASPALAHEEITPSTVSIGKPAFFLLSAANEASVDLIRISVTAPAGAPFGTTTRQPAGWTVQKSDTEITWSGGKVAPDTFEQWGFEIEGADQPGALVFKVGSEFANGNSDSHDVVVTAVADGQAPATTAPGAPATTVSPSTPSTPTTAAATSKSSDDSFAIAALIVALLSGLLAGVALIVSLRSRTTTPAKKGEDW